MDRLRQDLRSALRQMKRLPALTVVAVLVLALGIGTNAAVFAVIDGALFRPPPGIRDAAGLVEMRSLPVTAATGLVNDNLTYAEFMGLKEDPSIFEVAAWTGSRSLTRGVALQTSQGDERLSAELVSSAYFSVLRTPMTLGTGFLPPSDRRAEPVLQVVLGHGFWNQRMGASDDVIGRVLTLNAYPFTIVGVAPPGFNGASGSDDPYDVWIPANSANLLLADPDGLLESERSLGVIARLAPDVTRERAQASAEATGIRVRSVETPGEEARRLVVAPYRGLGSRDARQVLTFVGGAGGLVAAIILLIACVNVSALMLGRSLARRGEVAVRLALGASRTTIVRQLLTESTLLGLLSGAVGIVLATWALHAVGTRLFTFPIQLSPRPATVGAAIAVASGTGILFGLFPALHATRAAVFAALRDAAGGGDPRASRMRGTFAVAQLALSLPLLVAAGMLIAGVLRSVDQDSSIQRPDRLVSFVFDINTARHDASTVRSLLADGRSRVAALPGIRSASLSSSTYGRIRFPEIDRSVGQNLQFASVLAVDADYFATMGTRVERGRPIGGSDAAGALPTAVIDEDFARRMWPGEDPLGRTIALARSRDRESTLTVIGVTRGSGPEWDGSARIPVIAVSREQFPDSLSATLLVRTEGDPTPLIPVIRESINALDLQLTLVRTSIVADRLRASRSELTHATAGASAVGLLALVLACIGLYAVIAFGVAERAREIGVRIALGASRRAVVSLFIRHGLRLAAISLAIGLPLSFATVKVLGADMFGVARLTATHAVAMIGIIILLLAVAALSSWIPARSSMKVDPMTVLRSD